MFLKKTFLYLFLKIQNLDIQVLVRRREYGCCSSADEMCHI